MAPVFQRLILRQEIDGPQAEQLEFVPCGQILQNSRREEKLRPAQVRGKRPHIPHSRRQGDLPDYTCAERLLKGQKGRGCHPIVGDVNLP